MIEASKSSPASRRYSSYDEYLRHFYGGAETVYSADKLEAFFGTRLAKRILEVEATERKKKQNADRA
jgi:hypothetical protein